MNRPIENQPYPVPGALALAAFFYPLVAACLLTLFLPFVAIEFGGGVSDLVIAILVLFAYAIGASLVLAPLTLLVTFPLWLGATALRRLVPSWVVSEPELAAHVGALTALLGTAPVALLLVGRGVTELVLLIALLLGPGLATPIAQYAGARSQWRVEPWTDERPGWRFSLRQLLVITTIAALVLAILRLLGILSPGVLLFMLGWLVYQRLTLVVVRRFCEAPFLRNAGVKEAGAVLEGGGWDGEGMRG